MSKLLKFTKSSFQTKLIPDIGSRFMSGKKKKRDDCKEAKPAPDCAKPQEKVEKKEEACIDLNFKKVEVSIYDDDYCLPARTKLAKDCSTVEAKKDSCGKKKKDIPTGCRK
uniref:Uncharacterized protein n=1 Tax=Clastoptera arizonana TaxID=38151 RepID=A0A1B6EBM4_9HEMI